MEHNIYMEEGLRLNVPLDICNNFMCGTAHFILITQRLCSAIEFKRSFLVFTFHQLQHHSFTWINISFSIFIISYVWLPRGLLPCKINVHFRRLYICLEWSNIYINNLIYHHKLAVLDILWLWSYHIQPGLMFLCHYL